MSRYHRPLSEVRPVDLDNALMLGIFTCTTVAAATVSTPYIWASIPAFLLGGALSLYLEGY